MDFFKYLKYGYSEAINQSTTRGSIKISEKWNTGQNGSHVLCYFLLDADEALHEIQYLVSTWATLSNKKIRHLYDIIQE